MQLEYYFIYPDRDDPEMTKVSRPAGFSCDEDALGAAQDLMRLYPPFYTRVMIVRSDGELIADLVTTGATDTFPFAFQGIYCQKLGEMVYVS